MVINFLLMILQDTLLSAIAAVGFAMVFNVPTKYLGYCAILGGIGHGTRTVLMQFGVIIEWSTLLAAMLVGTLAIGLSRRILAHPKVISVAAIIPMFPGVNAYTAMIALVKLSHFGYNPELMDNLVTHFLRASFIVGALSLGLTLPSIWLYRHKARV